MASQDKKNNQENMYETTGQYIKNKIISRRIKKLTAIVILAVLIIVMFAATVNETKLRDAILDLSDPQNAPAAIEQYLNDVSVDENGKITLSKSIQELWKELTEKNNRITAYLDTPQQLARLINAQLATEFLDTRKNPDEPIDWSQVNADITSKRVQGIVKLTRAQSDGKKITMKYVSPSKLQSLIDKYNKSHKEKDKEEAMKYFTLEKVVESSEGYNDGGVITGDGQFTKYNLTEEQLRGLTNVCRKEQGSDYKAISAEASLMANVFEINVGGEYKGKTGADGLYEYVRYGKWFSGKDEKRKIMDNGYEGRQANDTEISYVRSALVEGKRTIPGYINEHDYVGDIESVTNNGNAINKEDPSQYVQHVSIIKQDPNRIEGGAKWNYYFHPNKKWGSDPFGYYLVNRDKIGDAYYSFEDGRLVNGNDAGVDNNENNGGENNSNGDTNTNSNKVTGQDIVNEAEKYVGKLRYVWRGESLTSGADCSGFAWAILHKLGLYSGSRIDSEAFRSKGVEVQGLSEAQSGDIICYNGHIGIYDGKGKIIEAKGKDWGITHDRKKLHAKK